MTIRRETAHEEWRPK